MIPNSNQPTEQCALLGYTATDKVYVRFIAPRHTPIPYLESKGLTYLDKDTNEPRFVAINGYIDLATGEFYRQYGKNYKLIKGGWDAIYALNQKGLGTYLVVNGCGQTDKDVTEGKAIFYEHDDIQKDEQMVLWQGLGLPEPTFQLDTGGKSIHTYLVFESPISIDLWKVLIADLIKFTGADKANKNLSRVMRLAGFTHYEWDVESETMLTNEISTIVTKSGSKYSYDELRAVIPTEPELKQTKSKLKLKPKSAPSSYHSTKDRSTGGDIPLQNCLTIANREYLKNGVDTNVESRNFVGASIARDLIGTANYLDSIGRKYQGTARELFDEYCAKCEPPIGTGSDDPNEPNKIWESALNDNPEPGCNSNHEEIGGIDRILESWDKKHELDERKCGFYSSIEEGLVLVHFVKSGDEGMVKQTTRIGNHIQAIAYLNNPENDGAALYLEMKDIRGRISKITLLRSELGGDGTTLVSQLMAKGYDFKRKQKSSLLDYLHSLGSKVETTYTITQSTGWSGNSFVLPHKTIGDETIKYRDIEPSPDVITETKGSLDGWKINIGEKCIANSRLTFFLGVAFAAPLLSLIEMESGGFHLWGGTSNGKSTTMRVAASVVGEKILPNLRTTDNGLESIATAHNNILLPLDELQQGDAHVISKIIYMLGNGQGKTRSNKNSTLQKIKTWNVLYMFTGEKEIGAYIAEAGITMKGGQEVRVCQIPAAPIGAPFGVFETIHGSESDEKFVDNLKISCTQYRGVAMEAFLNRLIVDLLDPQFVTALRSRVYKKAQILTEGTTDNAVSRAANRFALAWVALELAQSYGILPFDETNIDWSVKLIFGDWLRDRGGDGSIEIKQACDRIRHLLTTNQHSRDRIYELDRNGNSLDDHQAPRNLLAYRQKTDIFLVPQSVFKKEFVIGVNEKQLVEELQSRGWIISGGDRQTVQKTILGKKDRFYVFTSKSIRDEDVEVETVKTTESYPENMF